MKMIYCLFILYYIVSGLSAQTINIVSLTENDYDHFAVERPKYDLNKNLCAVMRVQTTSIQNVEFKGNIVEVLPSSSTEYLLYIPSGTKKIRVLHEDFLPLELDFTQFNMKIKGGSTYTLTIKPENKEAKIHNTLDLQYLVFKANKPINKIIVNGKEWPIKSDSTNKIERLVPCGKYEYQLWDKENKSIKGIAIVDDKFNNRIIEVLFH